MESKDTILKYNETIANYFPMMSYEGEILDTPGKVEWAIQSEIDKARREVAEEIILKWLTVITVDKKIESYRKELMTKLRDKYLTKEEKE